MWVVGRVKRHGHSHIPVVAMQIGTTFLEGNLAVHFKPIKMCISFHQRMPHLGLDYTYIEKISGQGWSPFCLSLLSTCGPDLNVEENQRDSISCSRYLRFFYLVVLQIFLHGSIACTQTSKRQRAWEMFTGYCWVTEAVHETIGMGDPICRKPRCLSPREKEDTDEVLAVVTPAICRFREPMPIAAGF